MYRVTVRQGWDGQEVTIHSENMNSTKLLSAKITKDVDSIDSFEFSISPKSPYYNAFKYRTTFVKVTNTKLNKVLFEGRVLPTTDSMDSSGLFNKTVTCEGLTAFLHDSIQDYYALSNNDLKAFLGHMIDVHNRQVDSYKRIKLGQVTVTSPSDNVYKSIDDSKTTYDTIKEKLIDKYGGEIRLRHEPDGLYLDYMPEMATLSGQNIRLASNLLSLKRAVDPSEAYSVIKPLGARAESENETGDSEISQPRLTIETVNNGSSVLSSQSMIQKIGYVVHAEVWDDVKVASILKSKGQAALDSQREIKEQFQVTAIDLSLLTDRTVDSFECGNYHQTINSLMGINERLRIVGQSLDICEPLNSTLSIGDKLLGQADYDALIRKQSEAIEEIKGRVASQTARIVTITNEMKATNEALEIVKNDVDQLKPTIEQANLGAFGDSITLGAMIEHPYHYWVGLKLRYETVNNYGVAGTRIAKPDINGESMCTRFEQLPDDLNAVVGLFGTNDFGVTDGVPLGEFTSRDNTTFYGACHQLIKGLSLKFIGKPLLIVTPLPRAGQNIKNKAGFVLNDYVKALIEVCQFYSVNCLNLYDSIGINPDSDPSVITDWTRDGDGLHPNEKYHELLGKRIGNEMLMMI